MALGLSSGSGGEFKSHVKYDARAGRVFRVDRIQTAAGWDKNDVDITSSWLFVPDLATIKVGWLAFGPTGPMRQVVEVGQPLPPRPLDIDANGKPLYKQGFLLDIVLHDSCGGGAPREFASNAGCVIDAMNLLHDAYTSAPEGRTGKLPAVKLASTVAVKSGQSTNYKPVFEIVGWVDRPSNLGGVAAPAAQAAPVAAPAPVAPAAMAPQPAPAQSLAFG